jgi:hypothetical protein
MIDLKRYLTKRNIIYLVVGVYIVLSALSLITHALEDKPSPSGTNSALYSEKNNSGQHTASKSVPTFTKMVNGITNGVKQVLCPLRFIVYLVWFAVAILLFILAFICDLITVFTFSLLERYFNFVSQVTAALIHVFEGLC